MANEEFDAIQNLKGDFQNLAVLTDEDLTSALESGGLLLAFIRAHLKKLARPRGPGRPEKPPKVRSLFQRRGRKSEVPLIFGKSNIGLAELAHAYKTCLKCSAVSAAEATLSELKGSCTPTERRQLAKLISEIRPRAYEKSLMTKPKSIQRLPGPSLAELIQYYKKRWVTE